MPAYVDAATLPHANTSGFDLTNHADDLYIFISAANHGAGPVPVIVQNDVFLKTTR